MRLLLHPRLAFGEAYMDGTLTVEDGSLYDFLDLLARNIAAAHAVRAPVLSWLRTVRRFQQYNPVGRAQRNVAHHYDLSGQLYDLFLDRDRQYSCAYFPTRDEPLEEAQPTRSGTSRRSCCCGRARRCSTSAPAGAGWRSISASECGVDVTGLTLSTEQLKVASERAAAAGLADRVRFQLRDYREETGRYDRIVSVGMFEHVGVDHYPTFFRKMSELLAADGVALLHAIGRMDGPARPIRGCASTSSPAAIRRRCPRSCRRSSRPACGSPTSRSCACTTPRRCATGAAASRANRDRDPRALRRALLPDVGVLSRRLRDGVPPRWPDRLPDAAGEAVDAVPLTRDYMLDGERARHRPRDGRRDTRAEASAALADGAAYADRAQPIATLFRQAGDFAGDRSRVAG